jgi:hypothetical protein
VQDIMRINRDQFEDTDFDMSRGLDAGPFGDTMRFPPQSKLRDAINGVSWAAERSGIGFQRPISLWRTAYSSITQSRGSLPDEVGAVTWIAQVMNFSKLELFIEFLLFLFFFIKFSMHRIILLSCLCTPPPLTRPPPSTLARSTSWTRRATGGCTV